MCGASPEERVVGGDAKGRVDGRADLGRVLSIGRSAFPTLQSTGYVAVPRPPTIRIVLGYTLVLLWTVQCL